MEEMLKHVGDRIRLYRKMRRMTVSELAERIYKAKATVSKYETAQISIDIGTLYAIADALDVKLEDLIDYAPSSQSLTSESARTEQLLYMYNFSPNSHKIVLSVISITFFGSGRNGKHRALCFYDVPSVDRTEDAEHVYGGTANFSDYIVTFEFQNRVWKHDRLQLILSVPTKADRPLWGIASGLSSLTLLPVCSKVIVTRDPVRSPAELWESLSFSKEDLRTMKTTGTFSWKRCI